MPFRFTRQEALGAGVRRLAEAELAAAVALLRDDTTTAELRVHGARKASKRVRALLRVIRAALPGPRFRAANYGLRDAARGLAAARDAAVALATFDELVPLPDAALAAVRDGLRAAAEREPAARPDAPALTSGEQGEAAREDGVLVAAAAALERVRAGLGDGLAGEELTWDVLADGLETAYRQGRLAMRAAFTAPEDEAFHDWRKRAKDLWYQVQLVRDACEPVLGGLEELLDELGERLGDDHDLAVLAAQPAAAGQVELAASIARRRERLRREAWDLGRKIYAERPRAFVRRVAVYWQVWRSAEPGQ
ncbi:MAG: CHAD domain-containing protein [Myxococcales bacterium]|nr:CHAD domain-containing protein [Myxococcales bacterium]